MRYLLVLLGVYGAYYYVTKHFEFHDTLVYAKKNHSAQWAPAVEYYVGMAYYQRTDYPKAQEAFTQLLTEHPTAYAYLPKTLIRLSDAAEYNRDWDTAKRALAQYLEQFPEEKDVELAKKRLELLKYRHGP